MSTLKVDKLDPSSGTALEIGSSGDTMTVPSGATLDISSATLTPPATMPASSAANLTSIPAANVTGVLPVGVTGGSGLTALGTVATGNISNSAIVYPAGHVINTWYKGSSRTTTLSITNNSTPQDCSCAANISVTSGNLLFLHWSGAVFADNANHWSFSMWVDGDATGHSTWGCGIYHGNTSISGWMSFAGQSIHVLDTTGTVTCELKANCNSGTIQITKDNNVPTSGGQAGGTDTGFGYDGFHWIAQEIQV